MMKWSEIQSSVVLKEFEWFSYLLMTKTSSFKEILELFFKS